MSLFYLYVKQHNQTLKKYLGYTKRNPDKYLGSGIDWTQHLKENGNSHSTYVIFTSNNKNNIKLLGRYYSEIWNIVDSDDWLNRIPETCSGGKGGAPIGNKNGSANKGQKKGPYKITAARFGPRGSYGPMSEENKAKRRHPQKNPCKIPPYKSRNPITGKFQKLTIAENPLNFDTIEQV